MASAATATSSPDDDDASASPSCDAASSSSTSPTEQQDRIAAATALLAHLSSTGAAHVPLDIKLTSYGGLGVYVGRDVSAGETIFALPSHSMLHVPKGAPDGHKIHFSEKADEIPDGEAGDVVFVLQEQPHAEYKRKGDDLFLERAISLTEALCGFNMELEALDGRKLIIKSKPGEVIKPVAYDPFREDEDAALWTLYDDCDTPSLENAAVAETEDINVCKKAVAKGQLKGKGIGCFVQRGGKTVFKQCTTEQAMQAKKPSRGAKNASTKCFDVAARGRGCSVVPRARALSRLAQWREADGRAVRDLHDARVCHEHERDGHDRAISHHGDKDTEV